MNIYCFSGLGADESVFQKLEIPGAQLHFIPWIAPLNKESLAGYALRIGETATFEPPYCLLGLSFGGMIAYELATVLKAERTFLISSATSGTEVNKALYLMGKTRVHQLIPDFILRQPSFLTYYFFGLKTKTEKALFRQIMKNTSPFLLKWAISAIIDWQPEKAADVIRIHGDRDLILPIKSKGTDYTIKDGTHFCVLQQADEISRFIQSLL